jgi:hypothetical protein
MGPPASHATVGRRADDVERIFRLSMAMVSTLASGRADFQVGNARAGIARVKIATRTGGACALARCRRLV